MNLKTRIRRLSRTVGDQVLTPCTGCGYPMHVRHVTILSHQQELGKCTECNRPTDMKGYALADHAKVIVIHDALAQFPLPEPLGVFQCADRAAD